MESIVTGATEDLKEVTYEYMVLLMNYALYGFVALFITLIILAIVLSTYRNHNKKKQH